MHRNAELVFDKFASPLIPRGSTVLEVGAGKKWAKWSPYHKSAKARGWEYFRCDVGNFGPGLPDYIHQPSEYEIAAQTDQFDAVIASQVLEHVRKPWLWIPELHRIIRPGGILVLVAPLTWLPHTRIDCWRVLPGGMRSLLEDHFAVEVCWAGTLDTSGVNRANCWGGCDPQDTIGIGRKV